MNRMRTAGILFPITSLPTPFGIGGFSKEAYEFIDFLHDAGQGAWQVLPLGPTAYGDSPYQPVSAFAGNPYLISLEDMIEEGYLTRDEEIAEHRDITMETAEIHSMSMEYFTYSFMDRFFGDRADDYRTMHFEDSCAFLPYGSMVDEFQHIVYANPEMTPQQRKQVWKDLEKVYRPELDFDGDPFFGEGGWWQRQGHIFGSPFYYIDYVLASVCAMQYKVKMDEYYVAAWQSYLKLGRLSAKKFYREELREVGLDIPFEDGTIEKLVAALRKKVLPEDAL